MPHMRLSEEQELLGFCMQIYPCSPLVQGWAGEDCKIREKRPCTNAWRSSPSITEPTSSTSLSDKGWTASRCAGAVLPTSLYGLHT